MLGMSPVPFLLGSAILWERVFSVGKNGEASKKFNSSAEKVTNFRVPKGK